MNDATDRRATDAAWSTDDDGTDATATGLWRGDTGRLPDGSRRALVQLVKGPYISGTRNPGVWSALLADEQAIRSRLHELFLELVLDRVGEFAFVRNVETDELDAPSTVRMQTLTFMDTAMLLVLRQMLLAREGEGRVIVGRDEVFEQLAVFRGVDRDEHDYEKRVNSSWLKMRNTLRVVHAAGRANDTEDRVEISPVLRLIVDAEQVRAITAEYQRLATGAGGTDVSGADVVASADVGSSADDGDETVSEEEPK